MNNISNQLIAIIIAIQSIYTLPALAEGDKAVDTSKVARVNFGAKIKDSVKEKTESTGFWSEYQIPIIVSGIVLLGTYFNHRNNVRTAARAEAVIELAYEVATAAANAVNPAVITARAEAEAERFQAAAVAGGLEDIVRAEAARGAAAEPASIPWFGSLLDWIANRFVPTFPGI